VITQITQKTPRALSIFVSIGLSVLAAAAIAQSDPATEKAGDQELVKQLANPVASLISVPFQNNFDFNLGTGHGWRYTLNFQPVVPIKLNDSWTLIVRTIVPFIRQGIATVPMCRELSFNRLSHMPAKARRPSRSIPKQVMIGTQDSGLCRLISW
jgi:hypothetical protein